MLVRLSATVACILLATLCVAMMPPTADAQSQVLTVGVGGQFATLKEALTKPRPGTTIVLKAGRHFERQVDINVSGLAGQPIIITSEPGAILDHGLRPLSAAIQPDGVSLVSPSYDDPFDQAASDRAKQRTVMIVVDDLPYWRVYYRPVQPGTFQVLANGAVLVRPYAGSIVSISNTVVVNAADAPYYEYSGIRLNAGVRFVNLDDLDQQGAGAAVQLGFYESGTFGGNIEVKNCSIKHSWQYAVRMDWQQNVYVGNCNVFNNGLTNFPRARYARDFSGTLLLSSDGKPQRPDWPVAIIGWNADNVTVANSFIHDNHGEGVGPFLQSSGWTIRNNAVADNWSVNIYSSTPEGDVLIDGNTVYNSGRWRDSLEDPSAWTNPREGDGIRVGNEPADFLYNPDTVVDNVRIINNYIIGTAGGISSFRYAPARASVLANSVIAHNTVATWTPGSIREATLVVNNGDNVTVTNNIVQGGKMVLEGVGGRPVVATNNLVPNGILTAGNTAVSGTLLGQPQFVGPYSGGPQAMRLVAGSPGDNAGVRLPNVSLDMTGRPRPGTPDIGALEN